MSRARRGAAKSPRSLTHHFMRRATFSPYFTVVKPTLARGFNHRDRHWADIPQVHSAQVTLASQMEGAIEEIARIFRMRLPGLSRSQRWARPRSGERIPGVTIASHRL
jgi:hypothetical protein